MKEYTLIGSGFKLRYFDFPRCFIYGEKSLPDRVYEELRSKQDRMEFVKNAGHSMAWENPEELALAISRLCRDCGGEQSIEKR